MLLSRPSLPLASLLCGVVLLTACRAEQAAAPAAAAAPWVRTIALQTDGAATLPLSATVRARYEPTLAFQVGGRILSRDVDAGQSVHRGDVLLRIDPRDLQAALDAARAEVAAADAQQATAQADLGRDETLRQQGYVSEQTVERSRLALREARTRLDAARSRAEQARNALGYAQLRAEFDGVIMDITGEPGQVVAPGAPVATLARQGEREIEVFLPDAAPPPAMGRAELPDGRSLTLRLREAAGALDSASRTRRARYEITDQAASAALPLGLVVRSFLSVDLPANMTAAVFEVPIGAVDERGQGPQLWHLAEDQVQPVAIEVLHLGLETATIRAPLAAGTHVVALGTHLLHAGMAVRELPASHPETGRRPDRPSLARAAGEGGPIAERAVGEGERPRSVLDDSRLRHSAAASSATK